MHLVNFLDGWAVITTSTASRTASARETARSTSARESTRSTTLTTLAVELHHDGVGDALKLLLLRFVLLLSGGLVVVEPGNGLVDLGLELLFVAGLELLVDLGVAEGVAEGVCVGFKTVLGGDTGRLSFIFGLVRS